MTQVCITTLLKKYKITDTEYLYKPIKTIFLELKNSRLYDKSGKIIYTMYDLETIDDDVKYAVDPFYSIYEEYKQYMKDNDSEDAIRESYFNSSKNFYYYAKIEDEGISTTPINVGDYYNPSYDDLDFANELLQDIKDGRYTSDELKVIVNNINRQDMRIQELAKIYLLFH